MPTEINADKITGSCECPFHICYDKSKKWICPFLIKETTGCAWLETIQPYYEEERKAKNLLHSAWNRIGLDDAEGESDSKAPPPS